MPQENTSIALNTYFNKLYLNILKSIWQSKAGKKIKLQINTKS